MNILLSLLAYLTGLLIVTVGMHVLKVWIRAWRRNRTRKLRDERVRRETDRFLKEIWR